MIKLAITVGAIGVLALITPAEAGGLKGGKVGGISILDAHEGLGDCYEGNTEGATAWANLDLQKYGDLPDMTASKSGGESGDHLDLTTWDCIPTYLVIKGGNGYVVLAGSDLADALAGDNKVWVSETCLVNGGGNAPAISHWAAYGCESVPEPSTALASVSALVLGALMLRRRQKA
jgi:hypothetical protein